MEPAPGATAHTFLEKDPFKERVLVAKHQALICSAAVSSLQAVEVRLMDADGLLQLLNVFGATLTEGCLGLTVALLALLGSGIDLINS